jgi:hypothetical protein
MGAANARTSLPNFFLRLADNPELLAGYDRNPRRAMAAAGLSPDQMSVVLSGDIQRLRGAVDTELAEDPEHRRLIVTPRMVIHTPRPVPPEPPEPPRPPEPPEPSEPPRPEVA